MCRMEVFFLQDCHDQKSKINIEEMQLIQVKTDLFALGA